MGGRLPKTFFNITFLPTGNRYDRDFRGTGYRILGEDDVGNFIGEAADGTVYLLDTAAEEGRELARLLSRREEDVTLCPAAAVADLIGLQKQK